MTGASAPLFGAFTAFWTAIAYELIDEHGFNQSQIAVFALIGAGGAAAAPLAGRLADRGYGSWGSGGALSSALTGALHHRYGWTGACLLAAACALTALTVWAIAQWRASTRVPEVVAR